MEKEKDRVSVDGHTRMSQRRRKRKVVRKQKMKKQLEKECTLESLSIFSL